MIKEVELIRRTVFVPRLLFQGRTFFGGIGEMDIHSMAFSTRF